MQGSPAPAMAPRLLRRLQGCSPCRAAPKLAGAPDPHTLLTFTHRSQAGGGGRQLLRGGERAVPRHQGRRTSGCV